MEYEIICNIKAMEKDIKEERGNIAIYVNEVTAWLSSLQEGLRMTV